MPEGINSIVYVDELEIEQSDTQNLTFFYFGVIVPADKVDDLELEVKASLAILGKVKFHARKQYKKTEYQSLLMAINEVMIKHKLQVVCFPFVKEWLDNPSLVVLKNLSYADAPQLSVKNYRSQAFLLFIHVLNFYFSKQSVFMKARVIFDHDWLQVNQGIEHSGHKLKHLEIMVATKVKNIPLLTLPDHTGYLFLEIKRQLANQSLLVDLSIEKQSLLSAADMLFNKSHLFNLLDLKEWIDHENLSAILHSNQ